MYKFTHPSYAAYQEFEVTEDEVLNIVMTLNHSAKGSDFEVVDGECIKFKGEKIANFMRSI